jgi:beta-glucosidase
MNKLQASLSGVMMGCMLLAMPNALAAQTAPMSHEEAYRRAEALLKQMTVEEKVGQMNQASGIVIPGLASEKPDDIIAKGQVGSVLWQFDVKELNRMQHLAVEKSRLHIPLLIGFDVIHGYRTAFQCRWPWPPHGTRVLKKPLSIRLRRMHAPLASSGPSLRWSI